MEIGRSDGAIMGCVVMFREIISLVESSGTPINLELALSDAVFDPIEAHVDGLGVLLLDGVIANAGGGAIVRLDGSGRLGMPEFL